MRVAGKDGQTPHTPAPLAEARPLASSGGTPEAREEVSAYERLMGIEDVLESPAPARTPPRARPRPRDGDTGPFRGGQDARAGGGGGTATEIGTTGRGELTRSIDVSERNFEFLNRLDANGDGVLERGEVRDRMHRAGVTRIRNESADFTPAESRMLTELYQGTGSPISLTYGSQRVGAGDGQASWRTVESGIARHSASETAPLGSVGQSRPTSLDNSDCGPASGLYMNDRRIRAATGHEPTRTHAEADALIRDMSASGGTTAPQMAGIMNDHFRHAGGRYYTHEPHTVDETNLASTLYTGLASDPGGVMVPTISTANEGDTTGTRHWLVVTGFDGENVTYYDPGGPDGARHERTMPYSELRDSLPAPNAISPNQVVYGTSVPESSAVGALPTGRRIGELEVRFSNRDLNVTSTHGIYGSRADAQAAAQAAAAASGEDAVVRREGDGYAVYGVTEIRSQFGGLWSDNTLADLDRDLTDVYMTDPTSGHVRRAASGPPP
ncbi:MAG: hypothetical protein H6730_37940 [Deltaproteobacteria bacterium]|nr:hypothetical protein [Deltaproteobacteria bacterium]